MVRGHLFGVLAAATAATAFVLLFAFSSAAQTGRLVLHVGDQGELVLRFGRLASSTRGTTQSLSLENNGSEIIASVEIECGFYGRSKLLGSGSASARDLKPGSSAHADITMPGVADADSVRCQISSD